MQVQNEVSTYFTTNKIDTIYFANIKVSNSGMRRKFSIFVIADNKPVMLQTLFTGYGYPNNLKDFCKKNGLKFCPKTCTFSIGGCGMDMLHYTTQCISKFVGLETLKNVNL